MPLLILIYIAAEIYVFVQVWSTYGFVNTFFALLTGAFLGAGLLRSQARFVLRHLQESVAQSRMPTDRVLHGMLVFIAGLLFILPGFVSDAIALVLILPGTRHLGVAYIKRHFKQQMTSGKFRVFTFGTGSVFGGAFGSPGRFGGTGGFGGTQAPRGQVTDDWARDVSPKVIDVTPISSETSVRTDPSKK